MNPAGSSGFGYGTTPTPAAGGAGGSGRGTAASSGFGYATATPSTSYAPPSYAAPTADLLADPELDVLSDAGDALNESGFSEASGTTLKDNVLFVIDARERMLAAGPDGASAFRNCLMCASHFMSSKIIASENDLVGVVLFGTKERDNPHGFDGIYVMHSLDVPDAGRIKELEEAAEEGAPVGKYGHGADGVVDFGRVLWVCSTLFDSSPLARTGYKRILVFTNDDSPCGDNTGYQNQAVVRASNLRDSGASMTLLALGAAFDASVFFQRLLDDDEDVRSLDDLAMMLDKIKKKQARQRAQYRLEWNLGADVRMSVEVFKPLQRAAPSKFAWLDSGSKPLKSQLQYLCKDTGVQLLGADLCRSVAYGDEPVHFTAEEVTQIKSFGSPGLELLGFKPMARLKPYHHVGTALFVYPSETIQGSPLAFAALHAQMLDRNVFALCNFVPRANGQPRLVALYPSQDSSADPEAHFASDGMHLIKLPFVDDIRPLVFDEDRPNALDDEHAPLIPAARKFLQKFTLKAFKSTDFPNPGLQLHYAMLQAIALDHSRPAPDDALQPPDNAFRESGALRTAASHFAQMLDRYPSAPEKSTSGTKRKREEDPAAAAKRQALEDKIADTDWDALYKAGMIGKMTVAELKAFLRLCNVELASGDRKADLVVKAEKQICEGAGAALKRATGKRKASDDGDDD